MIRRTIPSLILCFGLLCPLAALAQTRDQVMGASARCYGLADDRQWLDCYYGAAQAMRAKLGLPPAPVAQQNMVPPPVGGSAAGNSPAFSQAVPRQMPIPAEKPARPGLFDRVIALATPSRQKAEAPTHITAVRFDAAGYFTVELANGETWRQTRGDSARAHWRKDPKSYVVTLLPSDINATRNMRVAGDQVYLVEQVMSGR